MDTEWDVIKNACCDILKNVTKNRRYVLKRDYFDKMPGNEVSIKSPAKGVSDEEWQALTALWVTPRHRVCFLLQRKKCMHIVVTGYLCMYARHIAHLYTVHIAG